MELTLTNNDLYGKYNKLRELKKATYYKLLTRIVKHIREEAKKSKLWTTFIIPNTYYGDGFTTIDREDFARYTKKKLKQINPNVRCKLVKKHELLITWE
jgi:hypothetical protein